MAGYIQKHGGLDIFVLLNMLYHLDIYIHKESSIADGQWELAIKKDLKKIFEKYNIIRGKRFLDAALLRPR